MSTLRLCWFRNIHALVVNEQSISEGRLLNSKKRTGPDADPLSKVNFRAGREVAD